MRTACPFAAEAGTVGGWVGQEQESILLDAPVGEAVGHVGWELEENRGRVGNHQHADVIRSHELV